MSESDTARRGPLHDLRVVELAHIMAGPTCGRMLADMGADVIKIERVPDGDPTRHMVPPDVQGEGAGYMMMNRNKRGIALDLKTAQGQSVARRLLRSVDVVIENYRAGTMERLGLGYDTLRRDNPGLIYCEITGFGRTGPFADLGGFDLVAQGYSGLMSITGEGPGRPPVKCGVPVTDVTAGILAAMGVLAAYVERQRTGNGQRVDTSLYEAGITQTFWQSAIALATGEAPAPMGTAHHLAAPYEAFQTSDGWITLGTSNQANWLRLKELLAAPELDDDTRFGDNADRVAHRAELHDLLAEHFRMRSTAEWLEILDGAGIPAGPVATIPAMLAHPQTIAREMVVETPHSQLGSMRSLGFPVKFGDTAATIARGAPVLGEHTREVLREFGYSDEEVAHLVATHAVIAAS